MKFSPALFASSALLMTLSVGVVTAQDFANFDRTEKVNEWTVGCVKTKEGKENCVMFQNVKEPDEKNVDILKVTIGPFDDGKPAAIITAPLGVALIPGIGLNIDGKDLEVDGKPVVGLSYELCVPTGCSSALPLDKKDMLERFKKGTNLNINIYFSPDEKTGKKSLQVSLKGFSKALDMITKK